MYNQRPKKCLVCGKTDLDVCYFPNTPSHICFGKPDRCAVHTRGENWKCLDKAMEMINKDPCQICGQRKPMLTTEWMLFGFIFTIIGSLIYSWIVNDMKSVWTCLQVLGMIMCGFLGVLFIGLVYLWNHRNDSVVNDDYEVSDSKSE